MPQTALCWKYPNGLKASNNAQVRTMHPHRNPVPQSPKAAAGGLKTRTRGLLARRLPPQDAWQKGQCKRDNDAKSKKCCNQRISGVEDEHAFTPTQTKGYASVGLFHAALSTHTPILFCAHVVSKARDHRRQAVVCAVSAEPEATASCLFSMGAPVTW